MQRVRQAFPNGEVTSYAVNWGEADAAVVDYTSDVGLQVPVLLDKSLGGGDCWHIPGGATSLTRYYQDHVRETDNDPPFPLHVVIDADGKYAYLSRSDNPDALIKQLHALVDKQ